MAGPITGVGQEQLAQALGPQKLQQQGGSGGRSFESVLQQGGAQGRGGAAPEQPAGVSRADLERMSAELEERLRRLPPGTPNVNALLPDLLTGRRGLGMLREAIDSSLAGSRPGATDLRGRFGQIESEWNLLESSMRSNKDLSTAELLGLQARLYQVTQHVEVLSKVVDQVTGGIKTILNTNV